MDQDQNIFSADYTLHRDNLILEVSRLKNVVPGMLMVSGKLIQVGVQDVERQAEILRDVSDLQIERIFQFIKGLSQRKELRRLRKKKRNQLIERWTKQHSIS